MEATPNGKQGGGITVVGAGSIGGVVATVLRRRGFEVELVCRREEQAAAIRSRGLELTGRLGSFHVSVPAVSSIAETAGRKGVVFLATKAQDMLAPARELLPVLAPDSVVVSLQNGVSVDPLAEVVGRERVVGCVVGWGATMESDARIRVTSRGSFVVGRPDGTSDAQLEHVRELLSLILPVRITANIYGALYSKLMINACINSVGAVTGLSLGEMLAQREVPLLFRRIIAEATAVAEAASIAIEPYSGQASLYRLFSAGGLLAVPLRGLIALLVRSLGYGGVRSSTLQSLDRSRSTEIDWLNGYIVELGARHGVEAPINRETVRVVKEIERGERGMSPDNLAVILKAT